MEFLLNFKKVEPKIEAYEALPARLGNVLPPHLQEEAIYRSTIAHDLNLPDFMFSLPGFMFMWFPTNNIRHLNLWNKYSKKENYEKL